MLKTRKIVVAVLGEMWDCRAFSVVFILITLVCSHFAKLKMNLYAIDYNGTYVGLIFDTFFTVGIFAIGLYIARSFCKIGTDNFYDIESGCGLRPYTYVNIRLLVYVFIGMLFSVIQAVISIFTWESGIQKINIDLKRNYPIEMPFDSYLQSVLLVIFFIVIPVTVFVVLTIMLITMLSKSVFPAMAALSLYIFVAEGMAKEELNPIRCILLYPAHYVQYYFYTIKDKFEVYRPGFADKYTLEGAIAAMLIIIGLSVIEYMAIISILKRRRAI